MSEDVSATMRVGITVILVASLIATVLNLMTMSNSILANGRASLQGGIDQVTIQEFDPYNNKIVSGTEVKTALALFENRDIAIVIQSKGLSGATGDNAYNYGALLTTDGGESSTSNKPTLDSEENMVHIDVKNDTGTGAVILDTGKSWCNGALYTENGIVQHQYSKKGTDQIGTNQYVQTSARFESRLIKDSTNTIIGIVFTQINK